MQRSDILISLVKDRQLGRDYYVYPSDLKKTFRVEMYGCVTRSHQLSFAAKNEDEVWEVLEDNPNVSLVDDPMMVDIQSS